MSALPGNGDTERWLELVLEQLPAIVWTTDTHLRFTAGAGAGLAALGADPDELIGVALQEYLGTGRGERDAIAAHERALVGEESRYEHLWLGRWLRVYVGPLRDAANQIVGTIGLALDVTHEKETEEALRRAHDELEQRVAERTAELAEANAALRLSQTRLQKMIEQSPLSTQVVAPDGRTRSVNRAWQEFFGVTLDEIPDYNLLRDPQLVERGMMPYIERALAGEPVVTPSAAYRPDRGRFAGQERWCRAFIYPVKDEHGRIEELVLLHEDITDRKRAEDALAEGERRLRLLTDSLPVLIAYVDADQRYQFNNAAYENWFGIPREAFKGRQVREVVGDRAYAIYRPFIQRVLAGEPQSMESEATLSDGRSRWLRVLWVPHRNPTGEVVGYYVLASDVTEHRRAEESLRLSRQLAAVGTLAAGISHEINNPLSAILTSAGVALNTIDKPGAQERLRECLELIRSEGQRIERIVKSVHQFAREGVLQKSPADLNVIVQRAIQRKQSEALSRRIAIRFEAADGLPKIPVSAMELEQSFINLLSNAIEASQPGGDVTISTERAGESIRVHIQDRGCGMSADQVSRIFDPFYTTRAHAGGTGLGLSIVHGVIDHHGGRIDVQSRPGEGTRFTITLPLNAPDAAMQPGAQAAETEKAGGDPPA